MTKSVRKQINRLRGNLSTVFSFIHLSFIQGSNVLIQILIIPILTHKIGLNSVGHVMVAGSYAGLVSLLINYGSNQSGIKDVALHRSNNDKLSETFYTIFTVRFLLFCLSFLGLLFISLHPFAYSSYFILANAIVLGETLNPYYFFVGLQNLFLYNLINLVAKISSAVLVIFLIHSSNQGGMYNFYLGITSSMGYLILWFYAIKKYHLTFSWPRLVSIRSYLKNNFYLTGNNLSVQLQQSLFLFTVSGLNNPSLLGAYSICDKIVWSFRLIIIAFSNALFPKAVALYHQKSEHWQVFRKKINIALGIGFLITGFLLYFFAGRVVFLITGQYDTLTILFTKAICMVPLVAALNSMNVIDLLLKNRYDYIFIIALILLLISVSVSGIFLYRGNIYSFGFYPVIVELCSLPLYHYFIRRYAKFKHHPL